MSTVIGRSLKAPALHTKLLRTNSALEGKGYTAAGACLHTMAILQAYQADLLTELNDIKPMILANSGELLICLSALRKRPPKLLRLCLYAFPPIALLPGVLEGVHQDGVRLLLVAPFWPGQLPGRFSAGVLAGSILCRVDPLHPEGVRGSRSCLPHPSWWSVFGKTPPGYTFPLRCAEAVASCTISCSPVGPGRGLGGSL